MYVSLEARFGSPALNLDSLVSILLGDPEVPIPLDSMSSPVVNRVNLDNNIGPGVVFLL